MKFRVVNPELLTVADGDTGRIPFCFPAKFVRALEPNPARANDRFVEHLDVLLFLEVGLDLGGGRAFFANSSEQGFQLGRRKRLRPKQGSAEEEEKEEGEKAFIHFQVL